MKDNAEVIIAELKRQLAETDKARAEAEQTAETHRLALLKGKAEREASEEASKVPRELGEYTGRLATECYSLLRWLGQLTYQGTDYPLEVKDAVVVQWHRQHEQAVSLGETTSKTGRAVENKKAKVSYQNVSETTKSKVESDGGLVLKSAQEACDKLSVYGICQSSKFEVTTGIHHVILNLATL